jgi:hypothetical protein
MELVELIMAATFEVKCNCPEVKTVDEAGLAAASKLCTVCGLLPQSRIVLTYDKPWEKK